MAQEYATVSQSTLDIRIVPLPASHDIFTEILHQGARDMLGETKGIKRIELQDYLETRYVPLCFCEPTFSLLHHRLYM